MSTIEYYLRLIDKHYRKTQDYYYPGIIIRSLNFQKFTDYKNQDSNIVVKFDVSKYNNKNSWTHYGSVLFYFNLEGKLLIKSYDNRWKYRTGFNEEKYEYLFKQDKVTVNKYTYEKGRLQVLPCHVTRRA